MPILCVLCVLGVLNLPRNTSLDSRQRPEIPGGFFSCHMRRLETINEAINRGFFNDEHLAGWGSTYRLALHSAAWRKQSFSEPLLQHTIHDYRTVCLHVHKHVLRVSVKRGALTLKLWCHLTFIFEVLNSTINILQMNIGFGRVTGSSFVSPLHSWSHASRRARSGLKVMWLYQIITTREKTLQFHAYRYVLMLQKTYREWVATVNLNLLT